MTRGTFGIEFKEWDNHQEHTSPNLNHDYQHWHDGHAPYQHAHQ